MKLHTTIALGFIFCTLVAPINAMETRAAKKARMTPANQAESSASNTCSNRQTNDNNNNSQNNPLDEINPLHDKAIQIHSVQELDNIVKNKPLVMFIVCELASKKGPIVVSTMHALAKKKDAQSAYIYADIKDMPELKEKYSIPITQLITVMSFQNGTRQ